MYEAMGVSNRSARMTSVGKKAQKAIELRDESAEIVSLAAPDEWAVTLKAKMVTATLNKETHLASAPPATWAGDTHKSQSHSSLGESISDGRTPAKTPRNR